MQHEEVGIDAAPSAVPAPPPLPVTPPQGESLRSIEGRAFPEVAEAMDRSPTAARVLYCRALKALRVALESGREVSDDARR